MNEQPIFILGVGAQKAGTTWLQRTLASQPNVNMGCLKEYHVWDAKLGNFGKRFHPHHNPDNVKRAFRRLMLSSDENYGNYFRQLIEDGVHITGDITPSYAALDASAFGHAKDLLEKFGFDVRVIFLMRDPVERLWSALRMIQGRKSTKSNPISSKALYEKLPIAASKKHHRVRGDYISTIQNLEAVFDKEKMYCGLFEDLFTQKSVERLESFLNIKIEGVQFDKKVHASPKVRLPASLQKETMRFFEDQYEECNKRFPETKTLWHSFT